MIISHIHKNCGILKGYLFSYRLAEITKKNQLDITKQGFQRIYFEFGRKLSERKLLEIETFIQLISFLCIRKN